jgi:DNA primase
MGFIAQSFIEDLLSRVDIVDVINSRIPLRKAGRNYMACCPFHQEKTPSFSVVPHKQFFNCFGCGIAGSAIKFVMVFDSVDFVTAAEKLAASVGMEVQFEHNNLTNQQNKNNYKSYYEALAKITEYYQDNLNSNQKALNYLHKRAIDPAISTFFALGYALDGWDNLRKINFVHKTDVKNFNMKMP